ncbi:MAG: DUF4129 domain-containing protein [Anaerolineae bacterium]|nr:DUF4129 domain-containing protein [Anaerolineae bacterium]
MYSFRLTDYKWNWIDEGLLPYALAAMRTVWVGLLVHLFSRVVMPYRPDLISPLLILGLLAASIACTHCGVYVIKSTWRAVVFVVVSGLIAIVLTLYLGLGGDRPALWELRWLALLVRDPAPAILTGLITVWLWWSGIHIGRGRVYYDRLTADFTWGTVMLATGVGIAYATGLMPPWQVLVVLLLYFALGLAAMAIANLQSARHFEGNRTGQSLGVNRYWLGTVAVVIGIVLAAGLLLAQLLTPEAIAWVMAVLATVLGWLAWALALVFMVAAYPMFVLLGWLARLFRPLGGQEEWEFGNPPEDLAEQLKEIEPGHLNVSPQVYAGLHILAGVLVLGAIVLIFALAFRRFKTLFEEEVEETREFIISAQLLKEQLAQLLQRKRKTKSTAPPLFIPIGGDDPRAQIRRAYQTLLAWGTAQGMPRLPGQTPAEYLATLSTALPDYREALSLLTVAYQEARYSTAPIPPADAEQVLRAWQSVITSPG